MRVKIAAVLAPIATLLAAASAHAQPAPGRTIAPMVPPPSSYCRPPGPNITLEYSFGRPCAQMAPSPDGRYRVVRVEGWPIRTHFAGADGAPVVGLPMLDDGQNFQLYWSPRSDGFFVEHRLVGEGYVTRLRLFSIVGGKPVESAALQDEAVRRTLEHFPCAARTSPVSVHGKEWSRDGKRVLLFTVADLSGCTGMAPRGGLWMIGDVPTGQIDRKSPRVREAPPRNFYPTDRLYTRFRQ